MSTVGVQGVGRDCSRKDRHQFALTVLGLLELELGIILDLIPSYPLGMEKHSVG